MSLLHRSIEQIRRAQALSGNGPASRLLKAQADSALAGPVWPSPGLRRLLTGAALLIFSGLICLGAIYGLRQYKAITHPEGPAQSRTEPGESRPTSPTSLPPQPAASVDPPLLPASTASMHLPLLMPTPTAQASAPPPTPPLEAGHPQSDPVTALLSDTASAPHQDESVAQSSPGLLASTRATQPTQTGTNPAEETTGPAAPRTSPPASGSTLVVQSDEMEHHFSQQARRNQEILDRERAVRIALQGGDVQATRQALAELLRQIGPESLAGLQWQAYAWMKEGRWADAEACYRRILTLAPDDADSACNLLLTLLRQGRREEARTLHQTLARAHPLDQRLQELSRTMD